MFTVRYFSTARFVCPCCILYILSQSEQLSGEPAASTGIDSSQVNPELTFSDADTFIFHVDEVLFSDFPVQEYALTGWCGTDLLEARSELWLQADGRRVPCLTGVDRPDVARHFGRPKMRACGFAARTPVWGRGSRLEFFAAETGGESLFTLFDPSIWVNLKSDVYRDWLRENEKSLFWSPDRILAGIAALRYFPLISVILPTFNTDVYHLHRCVTSLMSQKYANWELCISDDGSWDPRTLGALGRLSEVDRRITVTFNRHNQGISASSNVSLERAKGEFVVLLDHDDELHPYALLEIVRQLDLTPDADLIYSDEDKIDQAGRRSQPAFKPSYDEDLLLAFNYIGHLVCIRSALLRRAGGFRKEYDGAQDWDLLLRVTELTAPSRIQHIAKPLYHWRLHETSTSANLDAKPYAQLAWGRVMRDCLERRRLTGTIESGLFLGSMRVKRELRKEGGIAVFTRLEHGDHQYVLTRVKRPEGTRFYELSFSAIYDIEDTERRPLLTRDELDAAVLIFLNCPLHSLNHDSLYELASQCQRSDCGLAGGTVMDYEKRVVAGTLMAREDSTILDVAMGEPFGSAGYMGLFKVVRTVPCVSPLFFATRSALLAGIDGWSLLSSGCWEELCTRLAEECHRKDLKILSTPYAVAEARRPHRKMPVLPREIRVPSTLTLNSNIATFPDPIQMLHGGR
jgi:hypothetical protein